METAYKNTQNQHKTLLLYVVSGTGTSLLGQRWLEQLRLNWAEIYSGEGGLTIGQVLPRHEDVFKDELGTLKGVKVTINIFLVLCLARIQNSIKFKTCSLHCLEDNSFLN